MEHAELKSFIESLNIEYNAVFVPFSVSRNAKEKRYSINWKVYLKKNHTILETDYMQGVGHLPKNMQPASFMRTTMHELQLIKKGCEEGKNKFNRSLTEPDIMDVLYCLVMDAGVLNCASFEEWADELGYDTDSRQAEKLYRQCLENALALRAMLGNDTLETLSELYSDY